jgi:outer membrane protein OmpA-like peptidoglycan-associated protein
MRGKRFRLAAALFATLPGSEASARQSFIIFFDHGEARISKSAAAILDNAAQATRNWRGTLLLSGHADRSGTPDYNLRLSCGRAAAVRDYLKARIDPAFQIAIEGWGEQRGLVETQDGIAEPQNRRVEFGQALPGDGLNCVGY